MITTVKVKSEYPEAYEILNNGGTIGRVEVRWCFCRAWIGGMEVYSAFNRDYWSGFSKHSDRQLHLEKIRKIAQDVVDSK